MEQTLYGDVLFLVNFTMDFLTIYVVGTVLRRPKKSLRFSIASAIGALYGVIACFFECTVLVGLIINLTVSAIMCRIAFGKKILCPLSAFYAVGCFLGGVMTSLYSLMNGMSVSPSSFAEGSRNLNGGVPLGWMAAVALVTSFAAIAGGRFLAKKKTASDVFLSVTTENGTFVFEGLCDSGNLLKEPLSGRAVIIMEKNAFLSLIPKENQAFYESFTLSYENAPKELRIIPADTVNGRSLLAGFIPKEIKINGSEKDAVIAMGNNGFDGKAALIPACLI